MKTSDDRILFVRRWNPRLPKDVSVLIFHGITAYSGPYGPLIANKLTSEGYTVFGMDLRGHGLSDGKRGDYPSSACFISDLKETVSLVKSKSKMLCILGHSLGALSAIVAANHSPKDIDGLILLSVAKKLKLGAYPKPKASALLKFLIGIALLRSTPLIDYRREGLRGGDDPLFNFEYSARFYSTLYGTGALNVSRMFRSGVLESPNLQLDGQAIQIPLLLGIGNEDELFSVESARAFWQLLPSSHKEFMIIPGGHHAFFPENSWSPLLEWLGKIPVRPDISESL